MAARPIFYNGTIKQLIVGFGSIFDNVRYISDHDDEITVGIHYAPKEKFIAYLLEQYDIDTQNTYSTFPRFAFEITGLNFAPERFNNPLSKMQNKNINSEKFMFSRVPYDFSFSLYLATKKFEDGTKIMEQILPYFVPELNISIKDKIDFDIITDIPVILNSVSFDIEYEGDFADRRVITWTLNFTVKAWLYGDVKDVATIRKTIVDLTEKQIDQKFETLISEVIPNSAKYDDPHIIVDTINRTV